MRWFRRHYGAGPLHLAWLLACFAVAAYAVTRVFGVSGWKGILLWFAVCLIGHDLIGWPIYTAADRFLIRTQQRPRRDAVVPWVNHVRVPVVISGTLLAMFFPLIFRLSQARYAAYTGFNENVYIANWLGVSAVLFGASGVVYLLRLARARRRRPAGGMGPSTSAPNETPHAL